MTQKVNDFETLQDESSDASPNTISIEDFDQHRDADLSRIKLGGRHFLIKAPKKETDSGIILSESTRRQVQQVQDLPSFNETITVAHVSEECKLVEVGDMILLSPHVQTLELVEDNVLYIIIHEDYVLATKKRG